MERSAGIIVYRTRAGGDTEFFVCTPGGPLWEHKESWNFPKGHIEKGEEPIDAALREFYEETNVRITDVDKLVFAGDIKQNSNKRVCTYLKKFDGEDFSNCKSNFFTWEDGKTYPEIGKYAWMSLDEIKEAGGVKAYYPLFEKIRNDEI